MQFLKRECCDWKPHDEFGIKTQGAVTEEFLLHMCCNTENTPKFLNNLLRVNFRTSCYWFQMLNLLEPCEL